MSDESKKTSRDDDPGDTPPDEADYPEYDLADDAGPPSIEARRAKLMEAKAKRDAIVEAREAAAEAAAVERELADLAKLEELEAEHGPLGEKIARIVIADRFTIFLKRAHKIHWDKYTAHKTTKHQHAIDLVKPHILHPPLPEVLKLAKEYPVIWTVAMQALNHLAGWRREHIEGE